MYFIIFINSLKPMVTGCIIILTVPRLARFAIQTKHGIFMLINLLTAQTMISENMYLSVSTNFGMHNSAD